MLKTNAKKVIERVKKYAVDNTLTDDGDAVGTFKEAAELVRAQWDSYKYPALMYRGKSIQEAFIDWACGLPNSLFDYIAHGDAVALVGDMLEETEEERAKYSDFDACRLLTYLLFREITKVAPITF